MAAGGTPNGGKRDLEWGRSYAEREEREEREKKEKKEKNKEL